MDIKKEKMKMKIYLFFYIIFVILAFAGAIYVLSNRGEANAGYALIPTLFGLIFSMLFQQTRRRINDNKE